MLDDEVFPERIDPMLLQEIFQHYFIRRRRRREGGGGGNPAGGTPETHTLRKQIVA